LEDTQKELHFLIPVLGTNFKENYILVPISSIIHPMFAFFTSITNRNWATHFYDKIMVTSETIDEVDSDNEDSAYDEPGDVLLDVDNSDEDSEEGEGE